MPTSRARGGRLVAILFIDLISSKLQRPLRTSRRRSSSGRNARRHAVACDRDVVAVLAATSSHPAGAVTMPRTPPTWPIASGAT
jgi:hypothetical protein